ncbi:PREDICTED: long-chain fatty acid transport protein 6-like isoform X3 [Gavialis gangeticus]|uniref:long-chain fatty acid transport protein 6-like isoform X3 n=1 Tax=Gavialis gangeticus TaxID=94835 RepID=UPI00092F588D|nr:PREDICTED: long-chain fatty acid transport protein 6-like isoform X3 [Gavialis gangeticus]
MNWCTVLCMWLSALAAGAVMLYVSLKFLSPYFWEDLNYFMRQIRFKMRITRRASKGICSLTDLFMLQVQKTPNKPFIIYEGNVHTYQDVDRRSNKVAQVFLRQEALKKGDTIALLMSNEPDFIHVWFGLAKLGFVVTFLNFNLHSRSLLHCVNNSAARALVIGADCLGCLEEDFIFQLLKNNIGIWLMSKSSSFQHVDTLLDKLDNVSDNPVPPHLTDQTRMTNTALYIFTSGSTGATCVLKKKFSASQFWSDCTKYNVTLFLYIGEICRYLCHQPKNEGERDHRVRIALGNGLRPAVWEEFLMRFGPIRIFEFYGSTEGNIGFFNYVNKIGAVGRASIFSKFLHSFELLKYDVWKEEPVKDKHGWCVKTLKGEAGLLVGQVSQSAPFAGYAGNQEASERKLLRDVFVKGDVYFNTGDLLLIDQDGFVYFTDRMGDTFRWKGENVATLEVSEVIGMLDFVQEANVYGVSVKGYEGRIGMVAIVLISDQQFDGKRLYEHVMDFLPRYAQPRFVRIMEVMKTTTTFKHQKGHLVNEGFNPEIICDPLYFLDEHVKSYIPLTKEIYRRVITGQIQL